LNAKYILFSYNNKSKIPIGELECLFGKFGQVESVKFPFKENIQKKLTSNNLFMGDTSENFEYIFRIKKHG
jgi:adenine-specific DNA methylase